MGGSLLSTTLLLSSISQGFTIIDQSTRSIQSVNHSFLRNILSSDYRLINRSITQMSPTISEPGIKFAQTDDQLNHLVQASDLSGTTGRATSISESLEDTSIALGINPSSENKHSPKEVRFSESVTVIEVPHMQLPEASHVTFDDSIVDIDTASNSAKTTGLSQSPGKHVRFGCLKQPKQPLSHGLSLLRILKRRTIGYLPSDSLKTKKRVRFGALKCQKVRQAGIVLGYRDTAWDEAETRRTFKREILRQKAPQPLSSIDEAEDGDEWDST